MATNYTADPTAAGIAPDTNGPQPETAPVLELFADGEAANAASVSQAFRTIANHLGWHYKPRAKAAAWLKSIKRFWTARGHTHYGFDHFGLPNGRSVVWREDLPVFFDHIATAADTVHPFGVTPTASTTVEQHVPGWYYAAKKLVVDALVDQTIVMVTEPSSSAGTYGLREGSRVVKLTAHPSLNDTAAIMKAASARFSDDILAVLEWDAGAVFAPLASVFVTMGLASSLASHATTILAGCYFKRNGTENWKCVTRQSGGGATEVDSGVAASYGTGAHQRFRVAWVGAGVDDSSAARALFWIDDALVANITTNLPAVTDLIVPWFGQSRSSAAAGFCPTIIGLPITYGNSIYKLTA
jgi:hypothetical protein